MGPHRTKWTQSRVGGENMETNNILTLATVGQGSKKEFSLGGVDLIL